jgi:xylulokinase
MLTLLALGRVTLADLPAMVEVKATYTPDPGLVPLYAGLQEEFVNLYKETKGIHKRLNGRRLGAHSA